MVPDKIQGNPHIYRDQNIKFINQLKTSEFHLTIHLLRRMCLIPPLLYVIK